MLFRSVNGQRENNEVGVSLPLILVQATVHRNLSYNPVPVVSYTILRDQVANTWSSSLVSAGTLCGNVPGLFIISCGAVLAAEVDLVGGGNDGLRGAA